MSARETALRVAHSRLGDLSRGFTLVEILVAVGLTAVLAAGVASLTASLGPTWQRLTGDARAQEVARQVLDRIAHDLESLMVPGGDGVWLAAAIAEDTGDSGLWISSPRQRPVAGAVQLIGDGLDGMRFGPAGTWLRFFCESPGDTDGPVAVAYQMIRRDDPAVPGGVPRYRLHRSAVRPAEASGRPGVFETGYDLESGVAGPYAIPGPGNDGSEPDDPVAVRRPVSADAILADDVIDFGVRIHGRGPAGSRVLRFPLANDHREFLARGRGADAVGIDSIELVIRVLTPEGARLIGRLEKPFPTESRPPRFGTDADWWWSVAEANSRLFVRRVELATEGLR